MKISVVGALVLGVVFLSGCVESTTTPRPGANQAVLACPSGKDCRAGGQSAVRVTVDNYGNVRGQAMIEEWSQWGEERPQIKYESTRHNDKYRRDGLNDLQRRDLKFAKRNDCYTYRTQNGEPACL